MPFNHGSEVTYGDLYTLATFSATFLSFKEHLPQHWPVSQRGRLVCYHSGKPPPPALLALASRFVDPPLQRSIRLPEREGQGGDYAALQAAVKDVTALQRTEA